MQFILSHFSSLVILLGVIGFFIAFYIYRKKHTTRHLVCPTGSDCDAVINSSYSTVFGISLETVGIVYYIFIVVAYTLIYIFSIQLTGVLLIMFVISACSALFSLYLGFLQFFVIRQFCIWCTSSLLILVLIVLFSYLNLLHP